MNRELMDGEAWERAKWNRSVNRKARHLGDADLTCPTCKRKDALTKREKVLGYQCKACTKRDEGVTFS